MHRAGRRPFWALLLALLSGQVEYRAQAQGPALNEWAQTQYDAGVAAARQGDYPKAYRSFMSAYTMSPGSTEIWYNMGLAAAHVPGLELRAGALFKAYLLEQPDSPRAAAIQGVQQQLAAKVNAELDTLLAQAQDQATTLGAVTTMQCPRQEGEVQVATLLAMAGRVDQAQLLLKKQPARGKRCGYAISEHLPEIIKGFAKSRHEELGTPYLAMWEDLRAHPPVPSNPSALLNGKPAAIEERADRDASSVGIYETLAGASLREGNIAATLTNDASVMAALNDLVKTDPSYVIHFRPEYARLLTCVDAEWIDQVGEAVPYLSERRNWTYSHDIRRDNADDELVRNAATFAGIGFTKAEDVTAEAIYDPALKAAWIHYAVLPDGQHPGPEDVRKIDKALEGEDELLRCLGNEYFEHRLLELGTSGFQLGACLKNDDVVVGCLRWIAQVASDPEYKFDALRQVMEKLIAMQDEVFGKHWYEDTLGNHKAK